MNFNIKLLFAKLNTEIKIYIKEKNYEKNYAN